MRKEGGGPKTYLKGGEEQAYCVPRTSTLSTTVSGIELVVSQLQGGLSPLVMVLGWASANPLLLGQLAHGRVHLQGR